MNPQDNIEKWIRESVLPGTKAADEHIVNDALAAYEKTETKKAAAIQPNVWGIIMNKPITKLVTAAVVIIAMLIGINQFGGSIDGATVAWGEVVEQINNYTKYKCRQRVVREKGPQRPTMQVYHLNLSQRRQEVENGDIHIIDMRGGGCDNSRTKTRRDEGDGYKAGWFWSKK